MGYTHYWSLDQTHPEWEEGFARLVLDAKRIIDHAGVPLGDGSGDPGTEPEIGEGIICLNGVGDDANESFALTSDPDLSADRVPAAGRHRAYWRGFCKTNRDTYDLVVCSILLRAVHHLPNCAVIGSDGEWEYEWCHGAMAWKPYPGGPEPERGVGARLLVSSLFGADQVPVANPRRPPKTPPPSSLHQPSIPTNRA
jgi:hypothetical protein